MNDFGCLATGLGSIIRTLASTPKSRSSYPTAVKTSLFFDAESVASSFTLAPYAVAYGFNAYVGSHIPSPLGTALRSCASSIQRWSLHNDEAFDRYQAATGYLGTSTPPENDEGKPVNWGPSVFYPAWTGSQWEQQKFVWGPKTPGGGGRDANGIEHYAD